MSAIAVARGRTQSVATLWRAALFVCLGVLAGLTPSFAPAQDQAAIPALTSPVVDTTGTLSAAEIAQLEQQALALQQRKGSQLQILIVPTTQPEDIAAYAQRAFDAGKLGRKGVDDGVLLLIAKDDRRARIHTGYGLEGAIPDITANRVIQEYLVPKLRAGDFFGGIADASAALVKLIDGEALPEPMVEVSKAVANDESFTGTPLLALFLALLVATFVRNLARKRSDLTRGLLTGAAAGGVAWLVSLMLGVGIAGALLGLFYGLISPGSLRIAGHGGWGSLGGGSSRSTGWGSGSSNSNSGWGSGSSRSSSGWSGGGGRSGGGGASGSW